MLSAIEVKIWSVQLLSPTILTPATAKEVPQVAGRKCLQGEHHHPAGLSSFEKSDEFGVSALNTPSPRPDCGVSTAVRVKHGESVCSARFAVHRHEYATTGC